MKKALLLIRDVGVRRQMKLLLERSCRLAIVKPGEPLTGECDLILLD